MHSTTTKMRVVEPRGDMAVALPAAGCSCRFDGLRSSRNAENKLQKQAFFRMSHKAVGT